MVYKTTHKIGILYHFPNIYTRKRLCFKRFTVLVIGTNFTDKVKNRGMSMKSFVREKRIVAGPYQEVNLYTRTETQELSCKKSRKRKQYLTQPNQKNWNDKKSKNYAKLLIHANFSKNDYYLTFTYSDKFLPNNPEAAKKHQENTIRKLKRIYIKAGIELKYMWFTSYQMDQENEYIKRIHHHVLVNNGIARDEVEGCWSSGRGKKKEKLGRTESKLIQPDSKGINDLALYLTNQEKWENHRWKKGMKRWSSSQNLIKPYETKNDSKWSQKKLEQLAMSADGGEQLLIDKFPNHRLIKDIEIRYFDDIGWHIHAELIEIEPLLKERKRKKDGDVRINGT